MAVSVHLTVRSTVLSAAQDATTPLAPATAVPTDHAAVLINKYQYYLKDAHMDYRTTLIDSREGVNLTVQEAKQMASMIAPLPKQGQTPYRIITKYPKLGISEKHFTTILKTVFSTRLRGIGS